MAQPAWTPLIPTPNHPEFPSAHALISAAVAEALTNVFGDNFELTLHTYDYLGLAPRSFGSFYAMADEMGDSRVYAGIHYQESCDKANVLGKTIGGKVEATIKFLKE